MDKQDKLEIKELMLETIEASLSSQLKAVRKLRGGSKPNDIQKKRTSQVSIAIDVLRSTQRPLHITELIETIKQRFGITVERDSLVSSLTKKLSTIDTLRRTARNTFEIIEAKK
jgi:hypothetical protein